MKKILLIQMPSPVVQAIAEQTEALGNITLLHPSAHNEAEDLPDLVLTGDNSAAARKFPGCPVLLLTWQKPQRLGLLLRQIGQMLAQPVLYIDDIAIGGQVFKPQEKSLLRDDGEEISLTDREVDILAYLVRHASRAVSRDALLKDVWQYQDGVDTHTLETHIYRLRQKIEANAEDPRILLTVDGGYSLSFP